MGYKPLWEKGKLRKEEELKQVKLKGRVGGGRKKGVPNRTKLSTEGGGKFRYAW